MSSYPGISQCKSGFGRVSLFQMFIARIFITNSYTKTHRLSTTTNMLPNLVWIKLCPNAKVQYLALQEADKASELTSKVVTSDS